MRGVWASGGAGQVAQQTCPPHPGYFGGMCVRCGSKRDSDEEGAADRPMEGPRPSDDASVALRCEAPRRAPLHRSPCWDATAVVGGRGAHPAAR